jgi:hypothetical protein
MMKGYVQLAAGLGDMSRRKAMDAARELIEGTPVAGLRGGSGGAPEALAGQVAAVADELMAIGRQNRRLLVQLVRTETEAVLASLGARPDQAAAPDHVERLEDQLRALRERVADLERQLRERASAAGTVTAGRTATSTPRSTPRTTKRTTKSATKAAAKRTSKAGGAPTTAAKRATRAAATSGTRTAARAAGKAAPRQVGRGRAAGSTS